MTFSEFIQQLAQARIPESPLSGDLHQASTDILERAIVKKGRRLLTEFRALSERSQELQKRQQDILQEIRSMRDVGSYQTLELDGGAKVIIDSSKSERVQRLWKTF